jgi:hypothetical protein
MEVNNRWLERTGSNYLYLPGVASNYATTPDAAALDITGDIDLRCKVALDDWTPAAATALLAKRTSGQFSYQFFVNTNGLLSLYWSTTGSDQVTNFSTVAPTVADGGTIWVRATLSVASNYAVNYYTSTDGTSWTQLGTTVTGTGATSIFAGTAPLEVGSILAGTANIARGKFFRAQVLNGINGTVAFDANFETGITSNLPTTFTESSANAATVTINYSGTGYRSAGVIASTYVFPGNPNTFKLSAYSLLDFGATDSFTALVVVRQWETIGTYNEILQKGEISTGAGYGLSNWANSSQVAVSVRDSVPVSATGFVSTYVLGGINLVAGIRDKGASVVKAYVNSSVGANVSDTTSSLANTLTLKVGRGSYGFHRDMEFVSAAIFRRALSASEIATLSSYFNGRVA